MAGFFVLGLYLCFEMLRGLALRQQPYNSLSDKYGRFDASSRGLFFDDCNQFNRHTDHDLWIGAKTLSLATGPVDEFGGLGP